MSLTPLASIMNTALTGLNVNQQALRLTASNIANVNTEGYVRQVPKFSNVVGGGVEVVEVRRIIDRFLETAARISQSDLSQFNVETQFHDRLQALFGAPDENASLSGRLDKLFAAFGDLALDPASAFNRQTATFLMQDFGALSSNLYNEIQALRSEASRQIGQDIERANGLIKRIHDLNPMIARETIVGGDPASLQEQRSQALAQLSELMDIRALELSSGSMQVTTSQGLTLVNELTFVELRYNPPGTVVAQTTFPAITAHPFDPSTGAFSGQGSVIDGNLSGGALKGLLNMRDDILPDMATELGTLTRTMIENLNAVHNAHSAIPAPNSLTGRNSGLELNDLHKFTGIVHFAVTDANANMVRNFTLDFGTLPPGATVGVAMTAINAGLAGDGTVTLNNGVMSFTATNSANGVVIAQDAASPSDRGGRGFSHFFGLNDVMEAKVPTHFDTGVGGTDAHGFNLGATLEFELIGPSNTVLSSASVTVGGAGFNDIITDLNASPLGTFITFALDTNGALLTTPKAGFEGANIKVINDNSTRVGTGISFTQFFGVGARFIADAASGAGLVSAIAADASRLAVASADISAAAGQPVLFSGDTSGALAFQALGQNNVAFGPAGKLPSMSATLSQFGAAILANAGQLARQTEDQRADRSALNAELEARRDDVSGVNLDEELANMIVFQSSYNAAARLITTVREMFDSLLAVI